MGKLLTEWRKELLSRGAIEKALRKLEDDFLVIDQVYEIIDNLPAEGGKNVK